MIKICFIVSNYCNSMYSKHVQYIIYYPTNKGNSLYKDNQHYIVVYLSILDLISYNFNA